MEFFFLFPFSSPIPVMIFFFFPALLIIPLHNAVAHWVAWEWG